MATLHQAYPQAPHRDGFRGRASTRTCFEGTDNGQAPFGQTTRNGEAKPAATDPTIDQPGGSVPACSARR
jgi:hypothetical protein